MMKFNKETLVKFSLNIYLIFLFSTKLCFGITADGVLENHFKAIGGIEKLRAIKNICIKGKTTGDTESSFIKWLSPPYSKTETNLGGCITYNGSNEKVYGNQLPRG